MEITAICHGCGGELSEGNRSYPKVGEIYLIPCEHCLEVAESKARDAGFDDGHSKGYDTGFEAGDAAVRDDVVEMLKRVKEADCAESRGA